MHLARLADRVAAMLSADLQAEMDAWIDSRGEPRQNHLKNYTDKVVKRLSGIKFFYRNEAAGTLVVVDGLGFQYGFGETFEKADADIENQNEIREGGKPYVDYVKIKPGGKHEARPKDIASRIEAFHGLNEEQQNKLIDELRADDFFDLAEWRPRGEAVPLGGYLDAGRAESAWADIRTEIGQGPDLERDVSQREAPVAAAFEGHGSAVLSADEGRDAPLGRADVEGSVAGSGETDHGASGLLGAAGRARLLGQDRRGAVRITDDGKRKAYKILLSEKADATTFIHELGHVYFDFISDYIRNGKGSAREAYRDFLAAVGVDPDKPISDADHEKLASLLEDYFAEGKTPSEDLADDFELAKDYFRRVYNGAKRANMPISDEIRPFFDRLFATDTKIREYARQVTGEPLAQQLLGMSPAEWADYLEAYEREGDKLTRRSEILKASAALRKLDAEARRRWNDVYSANRRAIAEDPAYKLRQLLTTGKLNGADAGLGPRIYLSRGEAARVMTGGARVPQQLLGVTANSGLTYEDLVKRIPGLATAFPSARAMYEGLMSAPRNILFEAKKRTHEILNKEFMQGIAARRTELLELLDELKFSPELVHHMILELKAIGARNTPSAAQFRAAARKYIDETPYRRLSIQEWRRNENYADRRFLAAIQPSKTGASGADLKTAARYREKQILARYIISEIIEEQKKSKRFDGLIEKVASDDYRKRIGRKGDVLLDVADAVTEAIKRKPVTLSVEQLESRHDLREIEEIFREQGIELEADLGIIEDILRNPTDFAALNGQQRAAVHSLLKQILWLKSDGAKMMSQISDESCHLSSGAPRPERPFMNFFSWLSSGAERRHQR